MEWSFIAINPIKITSRRNTGEVHQLVMSFEIFEDQAMGWTKYRLKGGLIAQKTLKKHNSSLYDCSIIYKKFYPHKFKTCYESFRIFETVLPLKYHVRIQYLYFFKIYCLNKPQTVVWPRQFDCQTECFIPFPLYLCSFI